MMKRALLSTLLALLCIAARPLPGGAAGQSVRATSCTGWQHAQEATTISLSRLADDTKFHAGNAAVLEYVPATEGVIAAAPEPLTCRDFSLKDVPEGASINSVHLIVSLAGRADAASDNVLVPSYSFDGVTWKTLPTVLVVGTFSNATHEQYWTFSLPSQMTRDMLAQLQVRFAVHAPNAFHPFTVFLDGATLSVDAAPPARPAALDSFFGLSEQPTVLIDDRSLTSVELLDADGHVLPSSFVSSVTAEGTRLTLSKQVALRPGAYIVRTKSKRWFRTVEHEASFVYGGMGVNVPKNAYRIGDLVPIAIGVVDDRGKTVCNAQLSVTVTKPDGSTSALTTADRGVLGSPECGAATITNLPDYTADVLAEQAGIYSVSVEASTQRGSRSAATTFTVAEAPGAVVERRGPTRINPRAAYVQKIMVTPDTDVTGSVTDWAPGGTVVTDTGGAVTTEVDGRVRIEWRVTWSAGKTYELSYTFDAPDESPAIFAFGPMAFGTFTEARQWAVASDEIVRKERADLSFASTPIDETDFSQLRRAFVTGEKPSFDADEAAVLTVGLQGFSVLGGAPEGLAPGVPLTVTHVDVFAPDNEPVGAYHVSETFRKDDRVLERLHLVPKRTFKGGEYRVLAEVSDGTNTAIVQNTFFWGVLVINTPKSVYRPGEDVRFGMAALDPFGNTVCNADMTMTVTAPDGRRTEFAIESGSIAFSEYCGPINVTNEPDYDAHFSPDATGDYAVSLTASVENRSFTLTDTLHVQEAAPFDITRDAPTRVWPLENYHLTLTVVPAADVHGTFEEFVPKTYGVPEVGQNGRAEPFDDDSTVVRWDVDWQAGSRYELTYTVDPEDVSPALFFLGPARVGDFSELRKWQIASDVISTAAVDNSVSAQEANHMGEGRKLVFTDQQTGYLFYQDGGALSYRKTLNGGLTWANVIATTGQSDCENFGLWYDKWTPGNTGTLIHVAFLENGTDDIYYDRIDTADDSNFAEKLVLNRTATSTHTALTDSISVARATDGDFYIAVSSSVATSTASVMYTTDVSAATSWNATADEGLSDATYEPVLLMPQPNGDMLLTRWVTAADDIQSKEYEDGANTWDAGWTDVDTNAAEDTTPTYLQTWSATLDPVTWNIHLAYVDSAAVASATPDVRTATYDGGAWTAKTAVISDTNTILGATIALNTVTGDVYVAYLRGSAATNSVYYKMSTDGMATWSAERGPIVNLATNVRALNGNFSNDGRLTVWALDDTLNDIWSGDLYDINAQSPSMQVTNFQGFESQDSTDAVGTSGTFSYSTSIKRSGDAALRSNPSNSTGYVRHYVSYATDGQESATAFDVTSSVFAMYVASGTSISNQTIIYAGEGSAGVQFEVSINANQTLSLTSGTDVNGSYALADDTWYVIAVTANADTDVHEVGIYSSDMTTLHESLTQSQAISNIRQYYMGSQTASRTCDIYFDDWMVYANNITGNFPLLHADYHVGVMNLDSASAQGDTGWTNDYQNIDEIPTSSSDYIETLAANTSETSGLESASNAGISGTVMSVKVMNLLWESSATTTSLNTVRTRVGAGAAQVTTARDIGNTTVQDYSQILTTQSSVNSVWTTSALDSLEVGVTNVTVETTVNRNGASVVQVAYVPDSTITISGGCRNYDDTADCTNDGSNAIMVAVDGVLQAQSDTEVDGSWSISGVTRPSAGQTITVFIDGNGDSSEAVTVTRYDGSGNVSNVYLYAETLTVGNSASQQISNYHIGQYDNSTSGDEDVFPDNSPNAGNTLTVDGTAQSSQEALFVRSSSTYRPYGDVGSGGLWNNGTVTADNRTVTLFDYFYNGGTYSAGTSTLVMTGTADLDAGGATLYNLTVNGNGNTVTVANTNVTVSGTLTIGAAADGNNDTLSIGSGRTLTSSSTGTVTLVGSGTDTISGSGKLTVMNGNLGTNGTLSSVVRFDTTGLAAVVLPNRTYGGNVEVFSSEDGVGSRMVEMGTGASQTVTMNGNLTLYANGTKNLTLGGATNDPDVTVSGDIDFAGMGDGKEVLSAGSGVWTVAGNANFTDGTYSTAANHEWKMTGTGGKTLTIGEATNFTHLTIDPTSGATVNFETGSYLATVTGTLTIASGDTLNINTGSLVAHSGSTLTLTGTLAGAGDFYYESATAFPTTGFVTVQLTMYMHSNDVILSERTYGGNVYFYNDSGSTRTATLGTGSSQTLAFSGFFDVVNGGHDIVIDGSTYNPAVNIAGYFACNAGGVTRTIQTGTGTWTVTGDVNFTNCTVSAGTGNTFDANGSGKTVTLAAQTLENLTVSGSSMTLSGTGAVHGNLALTGTVSGVTADVTMTGTGGKTVVGGGNTIRDLTIDPSSADTITLQTSDLTVSRTLAVADGDTLAISSGRTLTLSANSGTSLNLNTSGTVSGDGTLVYRNTATTLTTAGTISSVFRFDVANGGLTVPNRTFDDNVELYNGTATSRTLTVGTAASPTVTVNGSLTLTAAGTGDITFDPETNDPAVAVTGNIDFTGAAAGTEVLKTGSGAWSVGGNVDTTDGTFTVASGNVFTLNGSAQQTVAAGLTFDGLTVTNHSGADPDASPSVIFSGDLTTNGTFTAQTADTKLRFHAGSTYSLQNIAFNGQASGTRVYLRSSSGGSPWNLTCAGTRSVSYTDVKDSDATGSGTAIDASDGTNQDSTGNTNWTFNSSGTITFSISDVTLGFATLDPLNPRWATGDASGSASDVAAHTLTISTSATHGYSITYSGALLTGPNGTIDAASITNDADGAPGQEQFGIGVSTDGASTPASGYDHNATAGNRDWTFVAGSPQTLIAKTSSVMSTETISVYYLCNIAPTTQPGAYATNLTFVATGTF